MRTVLVDFGKSRCSNHQHLGKLPQIVDNKGLPVRSLNQYLLTNCIVWSLNTIRTYASHLVRMAKWVDENNLSLNDLTQDNLARYAHFLAGRVPERLKTSTCISALNAASSYLYWMSKVSEENSQITEIRYSGGVLLRGAIARLRILDLPMTEPVKFALLHDARELSRAMLKNDISGIHGKRNELIVRLMFESGLRVSEVAGLRIDSLPNSLYEDKSSLASIIGKGRKRRFIAISPSLLRELHGYIELERSSIYENAKNQRNPIEIFLGRHGSPLSTGYIQEIFRKASAVLGKRFTPHMLRHTYATYDYLLNRDIVRLQKLMGHADEKTTQVYIGLAALIDQSDKYHQFLHEIELGATT